MTLVEPNWHTHRLRKDRFSERGAVYAVCATTQDRVPLLWGHERPTDHWPTGRQAGSVQAAVVDPLLWLRDHGFVKLGGFAVMPDHAHAILGIVGEKSLSEVMHSWKRRAARDVNAILGRSGQLWQDGYYDHRLISPKVTAAMQEYIHANIERKFSGATRSAFAYCSAHPHWDGAIDWDWFT